MEESIMGIIWFMLFSIGTLIMVVYLRKYTNIERMALIENPLLKQASGIGGS